MNARDIRRGRRMASLAMAAACCVASTHAAASTYRVLHHFDGQQGEYPESTLVLDSAGVLHGTTQSREPQRAGMLFRMDRDGQNFAMEHDFDPHDKSEGHNPVGDLAIDASDTIFGALMVGGPADKGGIFSSDPVQGTRMLGFLGGQGVGRTPLGGVTTGPDGSVYGTTSRNSYCCGGVFRWDPARNAFANVARFKSYDYAASRSAPARVGDTLYGTMYFDAYSVRTDGRKFTYYSCAGAAFDAGLTPDAAGNLWGVARGGGANLVGGIYRIDPAGTCEWRRDLEIELGKDVFGKLLLGRDGLLYGTASAGGDSYGGTIFSYDPVRNVIKRLHSFEGNQGIIPYAGLVQDAGGVFYGTTYAGGEFGHGVIFRFVP
jgi:uncharacterized repeat protein (TIGR03803 family)